MNELKLIVDLMYEGGLTKMRNSISDTAEYGDFNCRGRRLLMKVQGLPWMSCLKNVKNGEFAKRWLLENQVGRPSYNKRREQDENHQIEKVGAKLRSMMNWID